MVKIGFTGTQQGMTAEQNAIVWQLLSRAIPHWDKFHEGDCIEADAAEWGIENMQQGATVMTIFFQIIGWYCIISGILLGAALWCVRDDGKSEEWKTRRTHAWQTHIGFLFTGMWILMH